MKAVSASIIALAGAVVFAAGIGGPTDQHQFAIIAGGLVGIAGLSFWARTFYGSSEE